MRDIINASLESLLEIDHPEYIERSRIGHEMKDSVLSGMKDMATDKNNSSYRAMTQALFESGFLVTTESDFNLGMLWAHIYGTKMHESIETFLKLFDKLTARGCTMEDRSSMYNPCGDNYYAAAQYQIKPDEDNFKIREISRKLQGRECKEEDEDFRTDVYRKVIYIENQSPTWAIVLDYSIYTNEPKDMHFLRLKEDYDDPETLQEMIDIEFDVKGGYNFSAYSSNLCRIVTTLDIDQMECKPVVAPKRIEHILFNIYSGLDSLDEEID